MQPIRSEVASKVYISFDCDGQTRAHWIHDPAVHRPHDVLAAGSYFLSRRGRRTNSRALQWRSRQTQPGSRRPSCSNTGESRNTMTPPQSAHRRLLPWMGRGGRRRSWPCHEERRSRNVARVLPVRTRQT